MPGGTTPGTPRCASSGALVCERHVIVARGRDYADIPPLKGAVTVEVTRLA